MADSRHFENRYIAISVKNHPILMKFCTQQQILNWMNVIKNEKVALDRLRVRQNVFFVIIIIIITVIIVMKCDSTRIHSGRAVTS